MESKKPKSVLERLIYIGISTFFLWPFVQLYIVKAMPIKDMNIPFKVSHTLQDMMEIALADSAEIKDTGYQPLTHYNNDNLLAKSDIKDANLQDENLKLLGKTEIIQHPSINSLVIIKTFVKWNGVFGEKIASLECITSKKTNKNDSVDIIPSEYTKQDKNIDGLSLEIANCTNIQISNDGKECNINYYDEAFDEDENENVKVFSFKENNLYSHDPTIKDLSTVNIPIKDCNEGCFKLLSDNLLKVSFKLKENLTYKPIQKYIYLRNIK